MTEAPDAKTNLNSISEKAFMSSKFENPKRNYETMMKFTLLPLLIISFICLTAQYIINYGDRFEYSSFTPIVLNPSQKKTPSFVSFSDENRFNLILLNTTSIHSEAVCLDGSPGAFYFKKGKNSGKDGWILTLEGGGWCIDAVDCLAKATSDLGSSKSYPNQIEDSEFGILGNNPHTNPHYYDWNKIIFKNCDGSSFLSYLKESFKIHGEEIYFRGFKIIEESIQFLLKTSTLKNAEQVILTGWSSGGISVLSFCDTLKSLVPKATRYSCLVDSGLFMDFMNVDGEYLLRKGVKKMFEMRDMNAGCNKKCIDNRPKDLQFKCFFIQYSLPYINSPIFFLNSLYDSFSLDNNVTGISIFNDKSKERYLEKMSSSILNTFTPYKGNAKVGYFLTACDYHVLSYKTWNLIQINNKVASDAFIEFHASKGEKKVKLAGDNCGWNYAIP